MSKRSASEQPADDEEVDEVQVSAKRVKVDVTETSTALITHVKNHHNSLILRDNNSKERISSLMTPEVVLSGHDSAIYAMSFDPSGKYLCSGSMDKQILLWDISNKCQNYNVLTGHKSAILEVHWPTETTILSCSADKTVAIWDANRGKRVRKFTEHNGIVNTCSVARDDVNLFASGSDDCTVILWDQRSKSSIATYYHDYQICSVALSHDGYSLYTAGIDNIIRRFDTRISDSEHPDLLLEGHQDTITGLALSPDNNNTRLLSNSMDSSLRIWDVRPFAVASGTTSTRCEHICQGVHHGAEKLLLRCAWSMDGEYITAGSADRIVHMWETTYGGEICAWQGHKASVNTVLFHPTESILASCSSDKTIILGEYSF